MLFWLMPSQTREVFIQWTPIDTVIVLIFSDDVLWTAQGSGSDADEADLLQQSERVRANGRADF